MIKIYPSLIDADLLNLADQIDLLEPHSDGFHLDVMDFHFVPNLTWGPSMINAIARHATKQLCVHLMVNNPEIYPERLNLRNGDIVSFHYASTNFHKQIINDIIERNWIPSIALGPSTPVDAIKRMIPLVPHITVMTVEQGFSGQQFLPEALNKVNKIKEVAASYGHSLVVSVDGGVNASNIQSVNQSGVDQVAVASAICKTDNPVLAIKELRKLAGT